MLEAEELVKVEGDAAEAPRAYVKVDLTKLQTDASNGSNGTNSTASGGRTGGDEEGNGNGNTFSDSDGEGDPELGGANTSPGPGERPAKLSRRFSRSVEQQSTQ